MKEGWYRSRATLQAFETLIQRMAALSDHKNLVWITSDGAFPDTQVSAFATNRRINLHDDWVAATDHAIQADMAVTVVAQEGPGAAPGMADVIAGVTGGAVFRDVALANAIEAVLAGVRSTYLITYAPTPPKKSNEYHEIRVICARKGVRIRTTQGY